MSTIKLAIGLCTYKREDLLFACLKSIQKINVPENLNIILVIVDNDINMNSQSIINKLIHDDFPFKITYEIEQNRGIPFARNRVLDIYKKQGIEHLAFIDDDETVQ